jgi:hypothetical protein
VLEKRRVTYPYRPEANRLVPRGRERKKPDDPGGVGLEIVREINACPECAQRSGS